MSGVAEAGINVLKKLLIVPPVLIITEKPDLDVGNC
jgi:hypothetical protein